MTNKFPQARVTDKFRYKVTLVTEDKIKFSRQVTRSASCTVDKMDKIFPELSPMMDIVERHVAQALISTSRNYKCRIWVSIDIMSMCLTRQFWLYVDEYVAQSPDRFEKVFWSSLHEVEIALPKLGL